MSGRMSGKQLFAMEFFLRFPETPTGDQGERALFRVKTWRKEPHDPGATLDVWAEVPFDAESRRLVRN